MEVHRAWIHVVDGFDYVDPPVAEQFAQDTRGLIHAELSAQASVVPGP